MGSVGQQRFRIGVDVGGTNTDAALVGCFETSSNDKQELTVLASSKSPTTADVTSGICDAVKRVLEEAHVPHEDVLSINIGTTHFVNAVTERDAAKLERVAVLRLCGPFAREIAPFSDWPQALRDVVEGPVGYFSGGLEIDGRTISDIKDSEIRDFCHRLKAAKINAMVVIGVFSSLDSGSPTQEEYVRSLILGEMPNVDVVCSRDIGNSAFIERENAAILNATILDFGRRTIRGFERAFRSLRLDCPLYLTQNDGTVMETKTAMRLPIKTFSSGATNSLSGALFLSGIHNRTTDIDPSTSQVIMVDIGGTTSDFAALSSSGFPRQSPATVKLGGVRTAFSMPELVSIGLGGGSHVVEQDDGRVSVGPTSVGYRLATSSKCFGGDTLTASDIVVASGHASDIAGSVPIHLDAGLVAKARHDIKRQLERSIDSMKVSDQEVVLLLVGGGSIIQLDDLDNIKACIRPPFYTVANAVGAAIAKISGEVDRVIIPGDRKQQAIVDEVKMETIGRTCSNGAIKSTVKIVDVDCVPLQYMTNAAFRIVVRACGELGWDKPTSRSRVALEPDAVETFGEGETPRMLPSKRELDSPEINYSTYQPEVSMAGEWVISETDLAFIAEGCGILGTGGGGSVYSAYLQSIRALRDMPKGRMRVVEAKAVNNSDRVAIVAFVGAPTVSNERLTGDNELRVACDRLAQYLQLDGGSSAFAGLAAGEIGGSNGMRAFATAASMDLPVIDADMIGRAFPKVDMCLPYVYGAEQPSPAAVADARGNAQIVAEVESRDRLERLLRCLCIEMGMFTASALSISGTNLQQYTCHDTVSQAWFLGRAILSARQDKKNVVDSLVGLIPGCRSLFMGRIVGVSREVKGGWTIGTATIERASDDEEFSSSATESDQRSMVLQYQNEFLYAALKAPDGSQQSICTTPDLITVLDTSGSALSTHELRYGLLVSVIAMPAHPLWTTQQGMHASDPASFGLHMKYQPFGQSWQKTASVIQQYRPSSTLER